MGAGGFSRAEIRSSLSGGFADVFGWHSWRLWLRENRSLVCEMNRAVFGRMGVEIASWRELVVNMKRLVLGLNNGGRRAALTRVWKTLGGRGRMRWLAVLSVGVLAAVALPAMGQAQVKKPWEYEAHRGSRASFARDMWQQYKSFLATLRAQRAELEAIKAHLAPYRSAGAIGGGLYLAKCFDSPVSNKLTMI